MIPTGAKAKAKARPIADDEVDRHVGAYFAKFGHRGVTVTEVRSFGNNRLNPVKSPTIRAALDRLVEQGVATVRDVPRRYQGGVFPPVRNYFLASSPTPRADR